MIALLEQVQVAYGRAVASETDAIIKLLAEAFSLHNPLVTATGVTAADFESFIRLLAPNAINDGLTVVARCSQTGMILGALLAEDGASRSPEGMNDLSHKFEPITDILNELTTMCPRHGVSRSGEVLHLHLLAVSDCAARRGIAQGLVNTCIENGTIRGYKVAMAEATTKVSQHVFCKLGFVTLAQVPFQFYLFKGDQVFASIQEHGGPMLMEKPLTLGSGMVAEIEPGPSIERPVVE